MKARVEVEFSPEETQVTITPEEEGKTLNKSMVLRALLQSYVDVAEKFGIDPLQFLDEEIQNMEFEAKEDIH